MTRAERSAFQILRSGTPKHYRNFCRLEGIESLQLLDRFDAEPMRWFYSMTPLSIRPQTMPAMPYPVDIRLKIDAAREYVARSPRGWLLPGLLRRVLGSVLSLGARGPSSGPISDERQPPAEGAPVPARPKRPDPTLNMGAELELPRDSN